MNKRNINNYTLVPEPELLFVLFLVVKNKTRQIGDIVLVAHVPNADDIALNIGGYINIESHTANGPKTCTWSNKITKCRFNWASLTHLQILKT